MPAARFSHQTLSELTASFATACATTPKSHRLPENSCELPGNGRHGPKTPLTKTALERKRTL
eukprot:6490733-Amphidinium_carterae.1